MAGVSDPLSSAESQASTKKPAAESVQKELEHIRLVHFTLLVTAATLAYVILSLHVFSLRPQLIEDFSRLRSLLDDIAKRDAKGLSYAWADVPTGMPGAVVDFVDAGLGRKAVWNMHLPLPIKSPVLDSESQADWFNAAQDPLVAVRTSLEQHQWEIVFVTSCRGNQAAWHAWLQQHQSLVTRPADFPSIVSLEALPVATRAQSLPVHLKAAWNYCHRGGEPGSGAAWQCTADTKDELSIDVELNLRWERRRLPDGWFKTRFPALDSVWESARAHDLPAAFSVAQGERLGELFSKKATLLGLEIEGRHLGIIGPCALLLCLIYLAAYVRQVGRFVDVHGAAPVSPGKDAIFVSPWIGAVYDSTAPLHTSAMWLFTAVTICVIPCVVTFYALRLLAGWKVWAALIALVPLVLLGLSCIRNASRMAKRLVQLG